ncbi:MAG: energy-coupling factor transporter transmembrane protein EcfT [Chloroflexi bacterium]|nr:MAG: energy-coupling factor transporter transmembrane protein EcfT [Chloroflexota bacterium]
MMRFQTVERDSLFTRLDFRPKLLMIAVISTVAFVWESPIALAALALVLVIACLLAGVKAAYIKTVVRVMIPFYILLLITHGFWNTDQVKALTGKEVLTPLFTFPANWWLIGGGGMSVEGLLYGWAVIFKTLALMLVIPLGIFTTEVDNMIVGLVRAKVPYKLVFIFSSTLRFFPLLFEEIQTIIEAQRLRGLAVEKMGPVKRVRVYSKVAIPLILGAMVKSQQLEVVLQSKAFTGSSERTYLHESVLRRADWAVIALFVLLFVLAAVLYFRLGVGKFAWLIFD